MQTFKVNEVLNEKRQGHVCGYQRKLGFKVSLTLQRSRQQAAFDIFCSLIPIKILEATGRKISKEKLSQRWVWAGGIREAL